MCYRVVPRPDVVSKFFAVSPRVDNHNQARRHDLAMEEIWDTHDCWFRLFTMFMGITLIDAWKCCNYHLPAEAPLGSFTVNDLQIA